MLRFQPYDATCETAVLALFQSNVPRYFQPAEEADLRRYLATGLPYFVAVRDADDVAVAAGGYALEDDVVVLTWGMVHADWQGQGLGRALTEFRLQAAARLYPHFPVELQTSQLTAPFYQKVGFTVEATEPDFWGPGLDLYHMRRP